MTKPCANCGGPLREVGLGVYRIQGMSYCDPCGDAILTRPHGEPTHALPIQLSDSGQNFAGVATIRAAIFDVLDRGRPLSADAPIFETWRFHSDESDEETEKRSHFADQVIARIAELQNPPHSGVKLENLCETHKRQVLPRPTKMVCGMCEAKRVKLAR